MSQILQERGVDLGSTNISLVCTIDQYSYVLNGNGFISPNNSTRFEFIITCQQLRTETSK